ncbi:MAG: hypothetical protein QY320_13195 [Gammaproteobacteria bacterium]|nr:MAG: hypothetical protein QY320_13195 [Gammaproteobacteria bacterium]
MARYEHLPIYRQGLVAAVHFQKVVAARLDGVGVGLFQDSTMPVLLNKAKSQTRHPMSSNNKMEPTSITAFPSRPKSLRSPTNHQGFLNSAHTSAPSSITPTRPLRPINTGLP